MSWEVKSLDELIDDGVIELGRGKVISKKDLEAHPGTYPVYSSAKENDGMFGAYGEYMFDEELITWSVDGGGNLFHRPKHKFSVTNVGGTLRLLERSVLDYQFLFHVLTYLHARIPFDWVLKAHPSVIRRLYTEIPLPPFPEQQRIVGKLDAAFAALTEAQAHVERNRANARELFESGLAEALMSLPEDEDPHALDSLLVPGRKISYGIVKPGVHDPNGVRLIKSQQVRNGEMDLSADFRITKKLDEEYARTRLQGGEILLNLVGASIGRSAVAPVELRGANVSRAIAVIPVVPELTEWVQYNLRGAVGQKLIQSRTGGSAQPVLNLSEVKALTIPMPSPEKRKVILNRLDSFTSFTAELETTYQQKLSELAGLKKAVLGAAFRGEL